LANPVFILVLSLTFSLQVLIVFCGGKIFKLDPNGLDLKGWLISIGVGSGTLLVGFLVRLLPDFNIPSWLLAGNASASPPADVIELENLTGPVAPPQVSADPPTSPVERWKFAISRVQSLNRQATNQSHVRKVGRASNIMVDPRVVAQARRKLARSSSK
jgi:Ca2+-transporting ATPase